MCERQYEIYMCVCVCQKKNRQGSVASTQRPSMLEGNSLFSGPISAFVGTFHELLHADNQFPFDVEFGWIPFLYEIAISRGLAQLHGKMSTQHTQLTANEKAHTEGLSYLKIADSRAASMVFGPLRPMRPGGRRVVKERAKQPSKRLMTRMSNSQEGHRVTRRLPNSHEGTNSGQESAEWLRVSPSARKAAKSFALDFHYSYCWPFNTIFVHFMPFKPLNATFDHFLTIFATWHGKKKRVMLAKNNPGQMYAEMLRSAS